MMENYSCVCNCTKCKQCSSGVRLKVLLFTVMIVVGLLTAIPVGVISFRGHAGPCILNAKVAWEDEQENESVLSAHLQSQASGPCNFVVLQAVFTAVVAPFVTLVYMSYRMRLGTLREMFRSRSTHVWLCFVFSMCAVLCLAASCTVSLGVVSLCSQLTGPEGQQAYSRLVHQNSTLDVSCRQWQTHLGQDSVVGPEWPDSTRVFYDLLHMAQVASWLTLLCWLGLVLQSFYEACRKKNRDRTRDLEHLGIVEAAFT